MAAAPTGTARLWPGDDRKSVAFEPLVTRLLASAQRAVGGYITILPSTRAGYLLVAREDAIARGMRPNRAAPRCAFHAKTPLRGPVIEVSKVVWEAWEAIAYAGGGGGR